MARDIDEIAREVADRLIASGRKVIFAESCTAGLVSATLAKIPGISSYHCGSAVVYREGTKVAWLGVSAEMLAQYSAVSAHVAEQMARGVLERTPEADLAVSVTGHLGPRAPAVLDGVIYIGSATRGKESVRVSRHVLCESGRSERQQEATALVLRECADEIARNSTK